MKIELNIGTDSLGDVNTDADNQRYADAVLAQLTTEYLDADITVELAEHFSCHVSGVDPLEVDTDEISENVRTISNQVWDAANY